MHFLEVWVGVAVGAVTLTGSVVAWGKLRGTFSGKPILLSNLRLALVIGGCGFGAKRVLPVAGIIGNSPIQTLRAPSPRSFFQAMRDHMNSQMRNSHRRPELGKYWSLVVVASVAGCTPQWPHGSLGPGDVCLDSRFFDGVARGTVVKWDAPTQHEFVGNPGIKAWVTPIFIEPSETLRGESVSGKTVFIGAPIADNATLLGQRVRDEQGNRTAVWFFYLTERDYAWIGTAELGAVNGDGGVTFPNMAFDSETAFRKELNDRMVDPKCAFDPGLSQGNSK